MVSMDPRSLGGQIMIEVRYHTIGRWTSERSFFGTGEWDLKILSRPLTIHHPTLTPPSYTPADKNCASTTSRPKFRSMPSYPHAFAPKPRSPRAPCRPQGEGLEGTSALRRYQGRATHRSVPWTDTTQGRSPLLRRSPSRPCWRLGCRSW